MTGMKTGKNTSFKGYTATASIINSDIRDANFS
jgi:hypothetical protein